LTVTRNALSVVCQGPSVELPIYRFDGEADTDTPRIMIVAGIHGREHGGIRTAYALLERLPDVPDLHGTIDVLPVANPESFAAERRENPVDGRNLGECFSAPGMDTGDLEGSRQTNAIARTILSRLEGCSHLLDLHSAGEARYLPHALFFREEELESAAAAGLPFALLRRKSREGATEGMLGTAALERGIPALALELGGGFTTWAEDVQTGVQAILSLLAHWEYISPEFALDPTPPQRVFSRDDRLFIRAWEEGAFYPSEELGRTLGKHNRIGTWVSLGTLEAVPVHAADEGTLIFHRSRCRTHQGDTLAMLLPEVSAV
jgi:predicted deacylase